MSEDTKKEIADITSQGKAALKTAQRKGGNRVEVYREEIDDPRAPCRPSWCLEDAKEFLEAHIPVWGMWADCASTEELLANLLDRAYLRGKHWASGPEVEVELDAIGTELKALKEPFLQLIKRLRPVTGGDDPEDSVTWVRGRISWTLWHELMNLYEVFGGFPPADNSWLDKVNKEEKPDIRGTLFDVEPKKKEQP